MLPKEIAIVHVSGHQRVNFLDVQGNSLAKKAALHLEFKCYISLLMSRYHAGTPFSLHWRRFN
jgi:hypothetical protein